MTNSNGKDAIVCLLCKETVRCKASFHPNLSSDTKSTQGKFNYMEQNRKVLIDQLLIMDSESS